MIDKMTVSELVNLANVIKNINGENMPSPVNKNSFFEIGKCYFVRTVTMYIVGKLIGINDTELLFTQASWVADTGRFHTSLTSGDFNEVEPFVNDVVVGRGAIIDATIWQHELPTKQK